MFHLNSFSLNPANVSFQNVSDISQQCIDFVSSQVAKPNLTYLSSLLLYSGRGMNQIGDQPSCLDLGTTSYYIGSLAINQNPTTLFMGVCKMMLI